MRKHLKKIRKSIITKDELIADAIFILIAAFVSFMLVFLFDIHQSFYEWPITLKFIFKTTEPYLLFVLAGTIIIFFIIKLFLFGIKEESLAAEKTQKLRSF